MYRQIAILSFAMVVQASCGWLSAREPAPDRERSEQAKRSDKKAKASPRGVAKADDHEKKPAKKERKGRMQFRKAEVASAQDIDAHVVAGEVEAPSMDAEGDVDDLVAQLEELGYVDAVVEADEDRPDDVTRYVEDAVLPGYNLFTPGGHTVAVLVDMHGREVWRWTFGMRDAWPKLKGKDLDEEPWRSAKLLPGGDLIGIWSGYGIVRIDKSSRLKWGNFLPVHHDFEILDDGKIVTLTRDAHVIKRLGFKKPVLEDFVVVLDADGKLERKFSVLEALEKYKPFDKIWSKRRVRNLDLLHTNTVHVLDGSLEHLGPEWRKGNLMTSMRHLDLVAIIDMETEAAVWHLQDSFIAQHDPQVVSNGRILVFDNQGGKDASRLLEYDPATKDVEWSYEGTKKRPFFTKTCGNAQRFSNGNTLANESAGGRAFEIDAEGRIVWEYYTPFRTGDGGGMVARFFEFERVPPSLVEPWLGTRD